MATLAISLLGAGRMGQELARLAADEREHLHVAAIWARQERPVAEALVSADLPAVLAAGQVAIDFTLPSATAAVAQAAVQARVPLVCGVSGLDDAGRKALADAATSIPVFYDRNMSVGIALMRRMLTEAGSVLGTAFEATISDLHHAAKRDAPSGTALLLGEALAAARGQVFQDVMDYPPGDRQARSRDASIHFDVRREGEHPGRHAVQLRGEAETLTLTHEVSDRRVFASGALRAARWLANRDAGLYDMQDLLAAELSSGVRSLP